MTCNYVFLVQRDIKCGFDESNPYENIKQEAKDVS